MSPTRRPRVVLDTNVVFSGLYGRSGPPFEIIHRWHGRAFDLVITPTLNAEFHRVIRAARGNPKLDLTGFDPALFTNLLELDAIWFDGPVSLLVHSRDPNDDMLLEAAIGGRASFLVTGDDDLLSLAEDPRLGSLAVLRPQAFLIALDTLR